MKSLIRLFLIAISAFAAINFSCKEPTQFDDIRQLYLECKLEKTVPFEIFKTAILGYRQIENTKNKNLITIIDYTKSSAEKRFFVIDIGNKKLLCESLVAHGKNSGENYATSFSNLANSLQSSLGFFLTAETYTGENGYSMKLDGLEKNINENARSREIVIHGAEYVSEEYIKKYGRLGRSWGCPSLPMETSKDIIDKISNGSCLFIYGDDEYYKENSNFIIKTH